MFKSFSLICLLFVSSLSMNLVLSAPSQTRLNSKIKQYKQSPKTVKAFGEEWHAVEDPNKDNEGVKGEDLPFKAQTQSGNGKDKPAVPVSKKVNTAIAPKDQHSSDFKTICEDKDANGKCLTGQSKNGPSLDDKHTEQSIEQLLQTIDHLISLQHKLTEKELAEIRQIIKNLSIKINELQKSAQKHCSSSPENSLNGGRNNEGIKAVPEVARNSDKDFDPREVAEIEERHIKERKLIKKKEHDEKAQIKSEKDSLKGDASKNIDQNTAADQQTNDGSASVGQNIPTDGQNSADSADQNDGSKGESDDVTKKVESGNAITRVPVNSQSSGGDANVNYLEGSAADVNFNGGINKPMNVLLEEHPDGTWPSIENQIEEETYPYPDFTSEPGQDVDNASDYYEDNESDMNVINMQEHLGNDNVEQTTQN